MDAEHTRPRPKWKRPRVLVPVALVAVLLLLAIAGVLRFRVFASAGHLEPAAEKQYQLVWNRDSAKLSRLNSQLGACNIGGNKQRCYEVSRATATACTSTVNDLQRLHVPSRFALAHKSIVKGLTMLAQALSLRAQAIASDDNEQWQTANTELDSGDALLQKGHSQLPLDAQPGFH
jgi:hypothetical protein